MSESRRRSSADFPTPGLISRLPLVLATAPASLQPPRLVVAFLSLAVLSLAGWGWDSVRGVRLEPGAIAGVGPTAEDEAAIEDALARWVPAEARAEVLATRDGATWVDQIDTGRRRAVAFAERATEVQAESGGADGSDDAAASDAPVVEASADAPDFATYRRDRRLAARFMARGEFASVAGAFTGSVADAAWAVVDLDLRRCLGSVRRAFIDVPASAARRAPLFTAVFAPIIVVLMMFTVGALARMSACRIGTGERLTIARGIRFAWAARASLLIAPLIPLAFAAAMLVPAVVAGLAMQVPAADVAAGAVYGVAIIPALAAAVSILGLVGGLPLMAAAVATERCDAIDAAQRPFSTVLRRPAHVAAALAAAIVATALVHVFASVVTDLGVELADGAATITGRPPAMLEAGAGGLVGPGTATVASDANAPGTDRIAAVLLGLWQLAAGLLVGAVTLSAAASASAAAWLVVREAADGQAIDEIWQPGMVPGTHAGERPRTAPDPEPVAASPKPAANPAPNPASASGSAPEPRSGAVAAESPGASAGGSSAESTESGATTSSEVTTGDTGSGAGEGRGDTEVSDARGGPDDSDSLARDHDRS